MGCGNSKVDSTTVPRTNTIAPVAIVAPVIPPTPETIENEEGTTPRRDRNKPVNEKGYKKRIRENLRNATAGDDIEGLQKNMETFQNNNMENAGDYDDACERLDFLKTRKDIRDACMRRHPKVLDESIRRVEVSKHKQRLRPLLDRAYFLKRHCEDPSKFKHDVQGLNQATVSEVRSYINPPKGVHETMIAFYMINGYPEHHLTDWSEITALLGRVGTHNPVREAQQAEGQPVDKDVALKARNYLGAHTLEEIREKSNGAAAFHVWSCRMVGKHDARKSEGSMKPLTNSGGKGPGQRGNSSTPKTPSTPSKVQNKKQIKEQENKAKQHANNVANSKTTTAKDNKQSYTQNAQTTKQKTAQQANVIGNKSTRKM